MKNYYKEQADKNIPHIYETDIKPIGVVNIIADKTGQFGAKVVAEGGEIPQVFNAGDKMILDFGQHCVGYLSFNLNRDTVYIDAPVRLKFKFGEVPVEILKDFSEYDGWLCGSWLQEEIITVDDLGRVELPRRHCFRYVEVTVLQTPRTIRMTEFNAKHVTSADVANAQKLHNVDDKLLVDIDRVAIKTLADCMHEVYEDAPKRDRRLWSGDFRVHALTDHYVFKNYDLARRCLYLFATCLEEGKYLPGCLFCKPELFFDEKAETIDFAFLYTVALCEYYKHTNDEKTVRELFPVAQSQIDLAISSLDENNIITLPKDEMMLGFNGFIDWVDGIKKMTSIHGVFLYALEQNIEMAKNLGEAAVADRWEDALKKARKAAYDVLYDKEKKMFSNEYDEFQYSVHSQVWMILGGALDGDEAIELLKRSLASDESVKPVTPYMHHYVLEAMVKLGMLDEAKAYIKKYWGGMVEKGADTFWEVYVPEKPELSPYGDIVMNSYCHAFSGTPAYFIRKYFDK